MSPSSANAAEERPRPSDLPWDPAPPYCDTSLYRRKVARPLARKVAPLLAALGFSGNGVSLLKLLVGLPGALLLVSTDPRVGLLGMLLLQVHFILDAADGDVARRRGQGGNLAGEYLDKLFDHLPKTAMYFFWGWGAFRLTGSAVPLLCGAFLAAWTIYPRFCLVETLLERLDKAPGVLRRPEFRTALGAAFVTTQQRGRADFVLTLLVHPAMNLLTLFFAAEILLPRLTMTGHDLPLRLILLLGYTAVSAANFARKAVHHVRALDFAHLDPPREQP
ncbi:MAG: CDP-alcohol phosphatidyltransferase family protein [Candidatus Zixiibacteriota bacterium]|nr:MAG: CDP-alcohol phosphatidyltransferase family protein [candidate division Zixibacteria bacterium]